MPGTRASDLRPDAAAANRGTARGRELLRESLDTCGVGRSILVDRVGRVIAGNQMLAAALAQGLPVEVVATDGHDLVVVQRTDLNLVEDPKARQLAYYDNRVGELDLSWSPGQVYADQLQGVDVGCAFFPEELAALDVLRRREDKLATAGPGLDEAALSGAAAVVDGPLPETPDAPASPPDEPAEAASARAAMDTRLKYLLVFETAEQQLRWFAFLRVLTHRYPLLTTPGARLAAYLREVGIR